ncbi:type VII secretion system-associated protein [Streptomyces sp. NPDC002044]|uniref:type VII secretion system-associated protein n=1 Tax=Streptomyces sp. NPDC002044 TaxID=3154662 RepID=UPI00332ED2D2
MAQNPPVNLDKTWLENFLNHDIAEFIAEIKKIMGDGTGSDNTVIPALEALLPTGSHGDWALPGAQLPITIGGMAKDSATNGQHITQAVVELIGAVTTILDNQKLLFDDIDDNLRTSIETLFKAQGDNLAKIEGDKFLDIFSDVDESLGGREEDD